MPHRCTLGCKSTGVPLHIFPNPNKFPDCFKTWVNLVGGKLEAPSDYEFYKKQRLCDIHFSIGQKNRFKRLNALAVPSLHLPGTSRIQQPVVTSDGQPAAFLPIPVGLELTVIMFKYESVHGLPGEGDDLSSFGEGLIDSQILNSYLSQAGDLLVEVTDPAFCDDTMDVQTKYPAYFTPISPRGPPERKNFAGDVNFIVEIDSAHTKKKKYLYSHRLNRIYVDMNENFSVGFRWDASRFPGDAYVRATTVFADTAQAEKRVERCYQHSHESSNTSGVPRAVIMNVLRSARAPGTPDVHYCGDPDLVDSWYSVVVRTPGPTELAYLFLCKSSCSSGINRRPIDVIFTLEDVTGKVYGRQCVGARVCSCPRRDIERDEEAEKLPRGKRPLTAPGARAKRVRPEPAGAGDAVITLPSIEVVGHRTALTGLEVMLSMMEQTREVKVGAKQPTDTLDTHIANLKKLITNLRK